MYGAGTERSVQKDEKEMVPKAFDDAELDSNLNLLILLLVRNDSFKKRDDQEDHMLA